MSTAFNGDTVRIAFQGMPAMGFDEDGRPVDLKMLICVNAPHIRVNRQAALARDGDIAA